jgi:hypothetical protein
MQIICRKLPICIAFFPKHCLRLRCKQYSGKIFSLLTTSFLLYVYLQTYGIFGIIRPYFFPLRNLGTFSYERLTFAEHDLEKYLTLQ